MGMGCVRQERERGKNCVIGEGLLAKQWVRKEGGRGSGSLLIMGEESGTGCCRSGKGCNGFGVRCVLMFYL